ncbi:MAG TPA: transposase [Nitrospirae bacterium]|nr:transposase [Nitrospirota bacterium]
MIYNPDKQDRKTIRLKGYDYAQNGAYFVTICIKNKECISGEILDGKIVLNDVGEMIQSVWNGLPEHYPHVELDQFVVMPNHMHGIVVISNDNYKGGETPPLRERTLGQIVAYFKYQTTKQINQRRNTPGIPVWQRNYFDRIIRNETELKRIRRYILDNPLKWHLDKENPDGNPDEDEKKFWKEFS